MLGLVLWALLIVFIVVCTCPGFIQMYLLSLGLCGALYALFYWIKSSLSRK